MKTRLYIVLRLQRLFKYGLRRLRLACDLKSNSAKRLELRFPPYSLPDPLISGDGRVISDAKTWYKERRPEILERFRASVYGYNPCSPYAIGILDISEDEFALNGFATRKEVCIGIAERGGYPSLNMLFYLPNFLKKRRIKVPLFLGLNFLGNHTIHNDPGISIKTSWNRDNYKVKGKGSKVLRGADSSSWPLELILEHGYGLATAYYGDIVQDCEDGFYLDIRNWFGKYERGTWGAIGAWAWGLSRAMDYIEQDIDLDAGKVIVMGHSRLGKSALWAGAQDTRFAAVISNGSGCGGAALARRNIGESVAEINTVFPHWFCDNFKKFNDREYALPVDQHELIALIAPRPVYIAGARHDLHADPMGEFLAVKFANPVFRLLGTSGFPATELPAVNLPVMGTMGYHIRKGRHGITLFDWTQFIDFADMHFINRHNF